MIIARGELRKMIVLGRSDGEIILKQMYATEGAQPENARILGYYNHMIKVQ